MGMMLDSISVPKLSIPESFMKDVESTSIQTILLRLEQNKQSPLSITGISKHFNVKRNKLSEYINVFSAVGLIKLVSLDQIQWAGRENITFVMKELIKSRRLNDSSQMMTDLFPLGMIDNIQKITLNILSLFYSLRVLTLKIDKIILFFSRESPRNSSILFKMYRIKHILKLIGIVSVSSDITNITLNSEYSFEETFHDSDPLPISFLMNRTSFIIDRRNEFEAIIEKAQKKTHIFP
uniref:E2F/DP family winged-helix DNA-binding domain-containing protein n=1 Tax=Coptotermes formosanus TaxID=36987 RepID=R4UV16_COPFO|nr:hypothetical protein [Coptotermes formosanus]